MFHYPARLGYWPAALGLFAFVWMELVYPFSTELGPVRLWCAIYVAVMLLGGALFGSGFYERGDPFEVYSSLVAKLSVWGRRGHHRDVDRAPQADRAELGREGVDELHPHEREEPERGRPVAEPGGVVEHPCLRVAAGEPGEGEVDGADRADRLPHRAEHDGEHDQAHPPPDVEDAEHRIRQQVLAEDRGHGGVGEDHEPQHPQGDPERRRVDDPGKPLGSGAAGRALVVARRSPRDGEDREGDGQGRDRPQDRELRGDREVLGPADPVGQREPVVGHR